MEYFLGVSSKRGPIGPEFLAAIESNATSYLPNDDGRGWQARHVLSPSRRSGLFFWTTDEGGAQSKFFDRPDLCGCFSGYIVGAPGGSFGDLLRLWARRRDTSAVASLGGVFAICAYEPAADRFDFFNTITRTRPLVEAETGEFAVVSNRMLLAALVASRFQVPSYNLDAMASFLFSGAFVLNDTPFRNVHVAPPNCHLTIRDGAISHGELDGSLALLTRGDQEPNDEYFDELAALLADSVAQFRVPGLRHELLLSGGRDSRTLAAAFHAQGVDCVAVTNGFADSADVLVARRLVEALDLPAIFQISVEGSSGAYTANVRSEMTKYLRLMDGMNLNIPTVSPRRKSFGRNVDVPEELLGLEYRKWAGINGKYFSGLGGECVRGGAAIWSRSFAQGEVGLSVERVDEIIQQMLAPTVSEIVNQSCLRTYQRRYGEWLEAFRSADAPEAVLEMVYLFQTEGKNAFVDNTDTIQANCDNRFVKAAYRLKGRDRIRELVPFEVIRRLAPELEVVPLEGSRWGFEAHGPRQGDVAAYEARTPVDDPWSSYTRYYPYYMVGTDLRDEFRDCIFGGPKELFDLVDLNVVERVFRTREIYHYRWSWVLWHVYAVSLMLSGEWLRSPDANIGRVVVVRHNVGWHELVQDLLDTMKEVEAKGSSVAEQLVPGPTARRRLTTAKRKLTARRRARSEKASRTAALLSELTGEVLKLQEKHRVPVEEWTSFLRGLEFDRPVEVGAARARNMSELAMRPESSGIKRVRRRGDRQDALATVIGSVRRALHVYEGK